MSAPQHLDISYMPDEDRVLLVVRQVDGRNSFWLTRRLLRALLDGLVELLKRSSDTVTRASNDVRSEVLLFEHMDAMTRRLDTVVEPGAAPGMAAGSAPGLLHQIDLQARGDQVSISLVATSPDPVSVVMSRDNAHQLVSMLYDQALKAQWDIPEMEWLGRRSQVIVPKGVMLS